VDDAEGFTGEELTALAAELDGGNAVSQRAATALRTAHLVAALTLAVTDGAFAHTSRTSPKRRRG